MIILGRLDRFGRLQTATHAVSLGKTGRRSEGAARVCESNSNHQAIIAHPDKSKPVTNAG